MPKSERNPKLEIRTGGRSLKREGRLVQILGLEVPAFGLFSDFGFRISDFYYVSRQS
jgi:hypothetical protein